MTCGFAPQLGMLSSKIEDEHTPAGAMWPVTSHVRVLTCSWAGWRGEERVQPLSSVDEVRAEYGQRHASGVP